MATTRRRRQLGPRQLRILAFLQRDERGCWYPGCGWIWDTRSDMIRVLDSLERAGLVVRQVVVPDRGEAFPRYDLTDAGRACKIPA